MEQGALQEECQAAKALCQQWKVCWMFHSQVIAVVFLNVCWDIVRADAQLGSTMVYSF